MLGDGFQAFSRSQPAAGGLPGGTDGSREQESHVHREAQVELASRAHLPVLRSRPRRGGDAVEVR